MVIESIISSILGLLIIISLILLTIDFFRLNSEDDERGKDFILNSIGARVIILMILSLAYILI
jgi:hypothetical protein